MFDIVDRIKGTNNFGWKDSISAENIIDYIFEPEDKQLTSLKLQIVGNETISMASDITDNYVENNVALQDHISIKPMIYTIEGEVGELVWYSRAGSNDIFGTVVNKLQPVVAFAPALSKKASKVQDKALKVLSVVDSIDNYATRLWNMFDKYEQNSEQKKIYKYLLGLWKDRTPLCIKTPWSKLSNFVIQNIEVGQSDRSREKSRIKISFKEFKTVKRKNATFNANKFLGRALAQNSSIVDKGTTSGVTATIKEAKAKQWFPTSEGKANLGKLGLSL